MTERISLFDWYLARLRRLADSDAENKNLTPLALVESDRTLIEKLVSNAELGRSSRVEECLNLLGESQQEVSRWFKLLLVFTFVSGIILAASFLLLL